MTTGTSPRVDDSTKLELKRDAIGFWGLVTILINSVVGAGIFGLPSSIARQLGDWAPWAYVLGSLMTAVTVAVVVELSSQFKKAGGAYLYVREAFGPALGIQTGWFSILARITTAAAIANLLMSYLAWFWPVFTDPLFRTIGVSVIVCGLALVNVIGVKEATKVSTTAVILKISPLIALVVLGFLKWEAVAPAEVSPAVSSPPAWQAWIEALLAMVFAYSGFESAMIPGSEIKDPHRTAKPAAFGVLLFVSILYLCIHLVVMHAVPAMAGSSRPLSDAAAVYAGEAGRTVIAFAAVASTFGWLSAAALTAPRLTYSMGKHGDLPEGLGQVHSQNITPWVSVILWAGLVTALAIYGEFIWNVVLSVSARLVVYSTMCAAAIKLRKTRTSPAHDGWRAPGGFTIPILGIGICILLASRLRYEHLILMLVVATLGLVTWFLSRRFGKRPEPLRDT